MDSFIQICLTRFHLTRIFLVFVDGTSSCGSGWRQSNGRCYRMFGKTNWISALRTCQSNGANLVSIESSTEQSYVEGELI